MIQILLVGDHPLVGEGTKLIIEKEPDMLVDYVSSANQAMEKIRVNIYDVMLIDLQMHEMDGFELTKKLVAIDQNASILIFSHFDVLSHFDLFMESGAVGFILKTATKDQLIQAIRCAVHHEIVVPFTWLKEIYQRTSPWIKRKSLKEKMIFNDKEKKIINELVKGKTNKEMAQTLFIGQRSLEYSLTGIFHKLGVQNRTEAVVKVSTMGIMEE